MAAFDLRIVQLAAARLKNPPAEAELEDGTREYLEDVTVMGVLEIGDDMPRRTPSVVVGLVTEDFDEGAAQEAGVYQRARAIIGVWHVIEARNTKTAERELDPLEEFLGVTRDVLQAWLPVGIKRNNADSLRLRRGVLERIHNNRLVWRDEYVFSWRPKGRPTQQN